MRLKTLQTIGILLVAFVASGLAKAGKHTKESVEAFQGEWTVDSLQFAKYELKGTPRQPMKVSFIKTRMVSCPAIELSSSWGFGFGRDGFQTDKSVTVRLSERNQEMTFRINPDKAPSQIDLEEKSGKNVFVRKGIYRLSDDELDLCIASSKNRKRPNEFKASNAAVLLRLKRAARKD